jgi:hypothetical protein
MQFGRITLAAGWLALSAMMLFAGPAAATFHEISIREVYPGSAALPSSEYVELQMWSGGQDRVGGHLLRTYDASGNEIKANPFPTDVSSGANQSTVLMATPEAAAQFGVTADAGFETTGQLSPAGGAVCWESLDCVAWGNFSGVSLPSPPGPPAPAIPDGMALRRTIAPGCATALEESDDRDNSAADFSAVFPAPRPNSVPPSERVCPRSGGGQLEGFGSGNQRGAPQTTLRRKPAKKTRDRTPTFRFTSDESGSTFQCKLDGKPFKACRSPFTVKRLKVGKHTFKVRARDRSGRVDLSPARFSFEVIVG